MAKPSRSAGPPSNAQEIQGRSPRITRCGFDTAVVLPRVQAIRFAFTIAPEVFSDDKEARP